MTERAERHPATKKIRLAYLLAGIGIGASWATQNEPLWQHALRLALILLVGLPLLRLILGRLRARRGDAARPHFSLIRFTAAKLGLVLASTAATLLLDPVTAHARPTVGILIIVAVAALGPALHPRLFVHRHPPEPKVDTAKAAAAIAGNPGRPNDS